MKKSILFSIALLTLVLTAAIARYTRASQERTAVSLLGVWKGNFYDLPLPGVEITLQMRAEQLAGRAVFYKVIDSGAGGEIKGKAEGPLVAPVFDGRLLSFQFRREDGTFYQGKVACFINHKK